MIGVFDSGIGGLTLLKEMMYTLPHENFLYYADTENVPYSYKTTEQIKEYVEKAVVFLRNEGCKAVVLACNTATNVTIEYLREKYDFPIIAIQPAVKVAFDNNSENKRILACATPVTLKADRFENLINSHRPSGRQTSTPSFGRIC
jgi:glutamate racemase